MEQYLGAPTFAVRLGKHVLHGQLVMNIDKPEVPGRWLYATFRFYRML